MDKTQLRLVALEAKTAYLVGSQMGIQTAINAILLEILNSGTIDRHRLHEVLDGTAVNLEAERGGLTGVTQTEHDVALNVIRHFVDVVARHGLDSDQPSPP